MHKPQPLVPLNSTLQLPVASLVALDGIRARQNFCNPTVPPVHNRPSFHLVIKMDHVSRQECRFQISMGMQNVHCTCFMALSKKGVWGLHHSWALMFTCF